MPFTVVNGVATTLEWQMGNKGLPTQIMPNEMTKSSVKWKIWNRKRPLVIGIECDAPYPHAAMSLWWRNIMAKSSRIKFPERKKKHVIQNFNYPLCACFSCDNNRMFPFCVGHGVSDFRHTHTRCHVQSAEKHSQLWYYKLVQLSVHFKVPVVQMDASNGPRKSMANNTNRLLYNNFFKSRKKKWKRSSSPLNRIIAFSAEWIPLLMVFVVICRGNVRVKSSVIFENSNYFLIKDTPVAATIIPVYELSYH